MSEQTHTHWTEDEDLLARFVLGQLDAAEASALDDHLKGCAKCRDAVQAERLIVAGVRRAGRDELKQRLAEKSGSRTSETFGWYRIAGAAAVLLVLLTVGILNRWFVSEEKTVVARRQPVDTLVPRTGLATTPRATPRSREAKNQRLNAESDRAKVSADKARRLAMKKKEQKRGEPAEELWLQGSVLTENMASTGEALGGKSMKKEQRADEAAKPMGLPQLSQAAGSKGAAIDSLTVTVKQLPLASMPARQRDVQYAKQLMQTLAQKSHAGLRITIFSDSSLSRTDLERATLQLIRTDSMLLRLGARRIGYKIPAGWLERRNR